MFENVVSAKGLFVIDAFFGIFDIYQCRFLLV